MKKIKLILILMIWGIGGLLIWLGTADHPAVAQVGSKLLYPAPRWPAALKTPRTVEEIMPFARSLARNKSNFIGLGLGVLNPGEKVLLVGDSISDPLYVEAIKRALAERKVEATVMYTYEIAGIRKEDEVRFLSTMQEGITAEHGFKEGCQWLAGFPGSQDWLQKNRPDLEEACFPNKTTQDLPADLKAISVKLRGTVGGTGVPNPIEQHIINYLKQNPSVRGFFYGRGGPVWLKFHPYDAKWLGIFIMDNRWDVVTAQSSYPADLWLLSEEQTMEPLASVDKVTVTDPEGTNAWWDLTEDQARRWVKGVYLRGHLFMFPNEAYGQFGQSSVDYPVIHADYIPLEPIVLLNGTVAGTNGHGGFFPRMVETWKDGYLTDVQGGGHYGDLLKTILTKYPGVNTTVYPGYKRPGYFYHFETALGTNPKFVRHPLGRYGGTSPERMREGVIHWALGAYYWHDPTPKYSGATKALKKFAAEKKLPGEHGFHVHNYFSTYKVHLRNTSKWITLVENGRIAALDSPQARSLASRYGDPNKVLATEWIPEMAGINVAGKYEDYGKNPYKYSKAVQDKIEAGKYSYFYPPVNQPKMSAALSGAAR